MLKIKGKKQAHRFRTIVCFLLLSSMLILSSCQNNVTEPNIESDIGSESSTVSEDTTDTPDITNDIEPIVWNFSEKSALEESGVTVSNDKSQGAYEFTSALSQKAVLLKYSSHSSYAAYRLLIQQNERSELSQDHTYIRVSFMTTQTVKGAINLRNTKTGERVTVAENAAVSKGVFVISEPIALKADFVKSFIDGDIWSIEYASMSSNSDFYLKEIAFFANKEDSYSHYGDSASDFVDYRAVTFGNSGNTQLLTDGAYTVDQLNQCVSVNYSDTEIISGLGRYAFGMSLTNGGNIPNTYRYVRVLYQAENPSATAVPLVIRTGAATSSESVTWDGIGSTSDWTLSDWRLVNQSLFTRITSGNSIYISFNSNQSGGAYKVKAIYFFGSKADAEMFEIPQKSSTMTIENISINGYSIILPEDAVKRERDAALTLQGNILQASGCTVPIVIDTETPVGEFEILIGKTNRAESKASYEKYSNVGADIGEYSLTTVNKKLVFTAFFNPGLETLMSNFKEKYIDESTGENIAISNAKITGTLSGEKGLTAYTKWNDVTNVTDPVVFTDNFSGTEWWSEENNGSSWVMANGALSSSGNGFELAYLQAYEKNAVFTATVTPKVSPSTNAGSFGLQLRYTSPYGYVRGGYDYRQKAWYIDYREGEDFTTVRAATASAGLTQNSAYTLCLTVENGNAVLYVNGQKLLETKVAQVSPGRVALYDYGVACSVDNVEVRFTGGMGQLVIPDVSHTVLPVEAYLEGGSVISLSDGKLHYIHSSGTAFVSSDDGKTFESEKTWYSSGYPSVIRLANGKLMRTASENYQNVSSVVVKVSEDEGKTWKTVGVVCPRLYANSNKVWAINMNDKLSQVSTGRIFLVQNFENQGGFSDTFPNNKYAFFEIYYSDDNGVTWKKSKTASYDLTDMRWFGEGKIIECANGKLRLMSSWNNYSTIMYSESEDGGETWGELKALEGFNSTCSSYAIMRDPNGPTEYTYYMVWCYDDIGNVLGTQAITMPRSRLSLAYSEDGINWSFLGDIWCWESNYTYYYGLLNHIVDPFIYITEDTVIIGSGISEKWKVIGEGSSNVHQAQRQHIWSIPKSSLNETYSEWPEA